MSLMWWRAIFVQLSWGSPLQARIRSFRCGDQGPQQPRPQGRPCVVRHQTRPHYVHIHWSSYWIWISSALLWHLWHLQVSSLGLQQLLSFLQRWGLIIGPKCEFIALLIGGTAADITFGMPMEWLWNDAVLYPSRLGSLFSSSTTARHFPTPHALSKDAIRDRFRTSSIAETVVYWYHLHAITKNSY